MLTRIGVIIALLVGSTSVALATDSDGRFDVNIYRPTIEHSPLDAFAHSPGGIPGKGGAHTRSIPAWEQNWLNKGQGPL
jgi:hypothetical protein